MAEKNLNLSKRDEGLILKTSGIIVYRDSLSLSNRLARVVWNWVWLILFRPTPNFFFFWRRFLLRLFGAKLGFGANVYPSVKIWAPWNLTMEDGSSLGPDVNCYSMDKISIGYNATVSQGVYLCTGSHDIRHPNFLLLTKPISIGANAWVAADAFIGPGVKIGEGTVVGARAAVFKNVKPWIIVGGNPARPIGKRVLRRIK
jgi:putative colanic acid biosynthesis acetyltransferase WcaF